MSSLPAALALLRWPLPVDAAAHGAALDDHLKLNLVIALALLTLAHVLLLVGVMVRRRAARPIHKLTLEYLPLALLVCLFAFLGVRANELWAAQRYTGASLGAMQVEVTGMQFAWYFRYPGKDATFGKTKLELVSAADGNPVGLDMHDAAAKDDVVTSALVLPAGREVDLTLRSLDVMHGFAVPELRLKQNAVPGTVAHVHFTAMKPGVYAILCTQVCGLGHYRMSSTVRVLPEDAFAKWMAAQEAAQESVQDVGAVTP